MSSKQAIRMAERGLRVKVKALQIVAGSDVPHCAVCKIDDVRVLTINHREGLKDVDMIGPLLPGRNRPQCGLRVYYRVMRGERSLEDLEVLCFNCNILHEYTRGNRGQHLHKVKL